MRLKLTLLALLASAGIAYGSGSLNYPGGITTSTSTGCVMYNADTRPRGFESTGVACNTAGAVQTSTFAALGTPANGTTRYCTDCAETSPCAGAGTGAFAQRVNGVWKCASGGGGSGAFNTITGGTNTTAAMVVGSGATLAATGTGTITATNTNCTGCIDATDLASTAVTPGSCTLCSLTIDADGRVTAQSSGGVSGIIDITADSGGSTSGANIALYGDGSTIATTRSGDDITISLTPQTMNTVTYGNNSTVVDWIFNPTGPTNPELIVSSNTMTWIAETIWQNASNNGAQLDSSGVLRAYGAGSVRADDVQCASACVDQAELVVPVPTPVATPASNPALSAKQCNLAEDGIVCEGTTANSFEGRIDPGDPTADRTWTFPDASGTLPLLSSTQTFSGDNTFTGQFLANVSGGGRLSVDNVVGVAMANSANNKVVYFDATTGVLQKGSGGRIDADNLEGVDWGTLTDTKGCTYDSASTEVDCNSTFLTAEVDGSTTNELPLAGTYMDVSGQTVTFDPTEIADTAQSGAVTYSDGTQTTIDVTYNLSGTPDPLMEIISGNVTWFNATLGSRASSPAINLVDSDIPKTAGQVTGQCTDSSNCTTALSYEDSGLKNLISGAGTGSLITIGSSSAASVTVTTDSTGDGEVVLPNNSVGTNELTTTGVTATSYTNASITVGADGRLTAASNGASIPAAFALYVDKSGIDSATCGPINAPCLTITGANGAQAKITAANDNGFATCTLDPTLGCGRCSTTTSTQCNEDGDCPGGETCAVTNTVCSALSKGTCGGATKAYAINIGAGWYAESIVPPSPGSITYRGVSQNTTNIYDNTSGIVFDLSNRTGVFLQDITVQQWGAGDAIGSTGGAVINGGTRLAAVHWGAGWDINFTGSNNRTNVWTDLITFGFTSSASGNSVHFQTKPYTCSNAATKECTADSDCTPGTCTDKPSHDFGINGGGLQAGDSLGGRLVWFEGVGCGDSFNLFLDNVTITGYDGGSSSGSACGDAGYQCGVVLSQTSCTGSANTTVRAEGVWIRGADTASGFKPPDQALTVGANTTLAVHGALKYDPCRRSIGGTLAYANASPAWAGGDTNLGVLTCAAPANPINGECWYDSTTNTQKCRRNSATLTAAFTRTHATDCTTGVTDGKKGDLCSDEDDGRTWVCVPSSGDCDTAGEWLPVGKQSTIAEDISADTSSFAAATTDYTIAHLDQWTNSAGGTLLTFVGDFITGGSGTKTFTCLMRNNGSTITNSTFSATADNNSPAHALVSYNVFTTTTINGTVDVRCRVDSGTTATVSGIAFRRITFDAPNLTLGTGIATFLATPSSANLAAALTDETGSGVSVFATSPTIVTPTIASFANATHNHTNAAGGGQLTIPTMLNTAIFALVTSSTTNIGLNGSAANLFDSATRTVVSVPTTSTIRRLYCATNGAPDNGAGTQAFTFTATKNSSNQSLTCTVSEAATSCNDTSNSFTVAAGDSISISQSVTGTPTSGRLGSCAIELDIPLT